MAGTTLTPSGTTGWNLQKWMRTVQFATYQKMVFIPVIEEGDRPYGTLNFRRHARVTGTALAQSADGTGLTYLNIIGTPGTVVPVGSVVPIAWSENEDAQLDLNLDDEGRSNIEASLAELTESNVTANVASLTQIMSATDVTADLLRKALGRLATNTNGYAAVGGKQTIYGLFSWTQYPNLTNIPEVNSAYVRGDDQDPYVKGIWTKGFGFMLLMSTVVYNDSNGWHNCLFIPSAFITAWNVRSRIKRQDFELTNRLIAYNNMGSSVLNDSRAIALRTTNSALV